MPRKLQPDPPATHETRPFTPEWRRHEAFGTNRLSFNLYVPVTIERISMPAEIVDSTSGWQIVIESRNGRVPARGEVSYDNFVFIDPLPAGSTIYISPNSRGLRFSRRPAPVITAGRGTIRLNGQIIGQLNSVSIAPNIEVRPIHALGSFESNEIQDALSSEIASPPAPGRRKILVD
jgi:hypothetical protein